MFVPNERRNKNNCSKKFIKLIAFYLTFKYNHSTDVPPDKSGEHNAFRSEMPGANAPLYACNRSQTLLFASKAECCSDLNHSTDVPPINQENITHFVPKYSELAIKVQLFFSLISLENILNFVK